MNTIKKDELICHCSLYKTGIHDNDYWVSATAVVINTVWICGECLANLWRPATEALKRYKAHVNDNKTKEEKIANSYGISIDPKTGKLKKAKALNRDQTLVKNKEK